MWSASIQSIHDTPVPSGDKVVNVLYTDGVRDIRRTYHLNADVVATAQAAAEFLQTEVGKLDASDAVAEDLEAILGQMITATTAPAEYGVPRSISKRQFFHALAKQGVITKVEALAAVETGTIPAELAAIVNALPTAEARFDAKMFLSGAVEFRRAHPLVEGFAQAKGWTKQQVDNLFLLAATL